MSLALGHAAQTAAYHARLADFRELDVRVPVVNGHGYRQVTDAMIAVRLGVSVRTVCRYRAAERAAGRGWRKNGRDQ